MPLLNAHTHTKRKRETAQAVKTIPPTNTGTHKLMYTHPPPTQCRATSALHLSHSCMQCQHLAQHTKTFIHTHAHTHAHAHAHIPIHKHTPLSTHIHAYTHLYTHAHTHAPIHKHTHTHMHTHTLCTHAMQGPHIPAPLPPPPAAPPPRPSMPAFPCDISSPPPPPPAPCNIGTAGAAAAETEGHTCSPWRSAPRAPSGPVCV